MTRTLDVLSLHPFLECNLKCPYCYRSGKEIPFDEQFWLDLIPEVKPYTKQIALGGGEPTIKPDFIYKFSEKCKENDIILNITSNGRVFLDKDIDTDLINALKNITMISVSYDFFKYPKKEEYLAVIKRLQNIKEQLNYSFEIGCNYLVTEPQKLIKDVNWLFNNAKVNRVFALCPKTPLPAPNILEYRPYYLYLTQRYQHFYVDDLSRNIIENESYDNWKNECHYGKLVSIDEKYFSKGCSFCSDDNIIGKLEKPSDFHKIIEKLETLKGKNYCPFLKLKNNIKD